MVDAQGLLLAVAVHPANIQDRDGAKLVLQRLLGRFPHLERFWADGAYAGKLVEWLRHSGGWKLASGRQYIRDVWWVVVAPGTAIFMTALSFNLFGVWLQAVSDPLQRWRRLKMTKEAKEAGVQF